MASQRDPRLLLVMSNDYGELGNARYLLYGQDRLLANAEFLLPPKLYKRNPHIFGRATQVYDSIDGILALIDAQQPDVVCLFSGYLFAWDGLLTVDSVARIVDLAKTRGFQLVTSDPYLGLLAKPVPRITDAHDSFQTLFGVLHEAAHFYPVPCHQLAPSSKLRGVATFNAKLVRDLDHREPPPLARVTGDAEPPLWLFILGSNDYELQSAAMGRDWFISTLTEKLRNAREAGRRPVLLAPENCRQAVSRKWGPDCRQADLVSFCGYDEFTALLLNAEAAFYWNVVSNSMFHRVLNGLPNFFFDPGHLGRIQSIYDLAVQNYFAGWEPVCLDTRQGLSLELLRIVEGVFQSQFARMRDQFRAAPSPPELISQLCAGGAPAR